VRRCWGILCGPLPLPCGVPVQKKHAGRSAKDGTRYVGLGLWGGRNIIPAKLDGGEVGAFKPRGGMEKVVDEGMRKGGGSQTGKKIRASSGVESSWLE